MRRSNSLNNSSKSTSSTTSSMSRSEFQRLMKQKRQQQSQTEAKSALIIFDVSPVQVEQLIQKLVALCQDKKLKNVCRCHYHQRCGNEGWKHEHDICDLISTLQSLLSATPQETTPPMLVAEVHSTIGVLYQQKLQQDARATQSFLQALWVQTACEDCTSVQLGLTRTRLGLIYGRASRYPEACHLLEMAVDDFQAGELAEHHELMVRATQALAAFTEMSNRKRSSSSSSSSRRNSDSSTGTISSTKRNSKVTTAA